ncbi:hypothetical protein PJP10_32210, partial [Mycobacterium kansasii]
AASGWKTLAFMRCFEVVSRLKVNIPKSELLGICASKEEVESLAKVFESVGVWCVGLHVVLLSL